MDIKLRRWARRIAGANAEYDRDHVQQNALRDGSTPIADICDRQLVQCTGTVTDVAVHHVGENARSLLVALDDGSRVLTLSWLGRRQIAGIEPGVMLTVSGRVAYKRGLPVMFNPRYEILPCNPRKK